MTDPTDATAEVTGDVLNYDDALTAEVGDAADDEITGTFHDNTDDAEEDDDTTGGDA